MLYNCSALKIPPDYSEVEKTLNRTIETNYFIYHLADDDTIEQQRNEIYCKWLTNKIKIYPEDKIHYYKYSDTNQKYLFTKTKGNSVVLFNRINTIHPFDNHEIVHVLVGTYVGNPPKLFTEGIAVANQVNPIENDFVVRWGKESIDNLSYEYKLKSMIPPIDSLLIMNHFFKYGENITYPVSGSFVKYLLEIYGYDVFYKFIKECDWRCSSNEIKEIFYKKYGVSIDAAWSKWLSYLEQKE